ncbi:PAS domain S-box protein [Myxococcota bacterium]|nr:PAS domain S-box protein [Myxococcota bacterium]MBU1537455.1 PAS domain S-box protein [Myxococcota bacterium]
MGRPSWGPLLSLILFLAIVIPGGLYALLRVALPHLKGSVEYQLASIPVMVVCGSGLFAAVRAWRRGRAQGPAVSGIVALLLLSGAPLILAAGDRAAGTALAGYWLVMTAVLIQFFHGLPVAQQGKFHGPAVPVAPVDNKKLKSHSDALFQAYIRSSQVAVLIHRGDKWIFCNEAAALLTGYSANELKALYFWEIVPPESAPRMKSARKKMLNGLELFDKHAVRILTKNGDERWADVRVEVIQYRKEVSYMVTAIDMTELKLAENAIQSAYVDLEEQVRERTSDLEEANLRLKLQARGLDQLKDAVIITDADKMILYCNEGFQRITGYTCTEVIGSMQAIFTGQLCSKEVYLEMLAKLDQGLPWKGTVINRRRSKTLYIEETTISPVSFEEGEVTHYISVLRDVSTQVAMEKRLVQSQKLQTMGQLASGVAHEVNTPVQFIGDNIHFLENSFDQILWLLTSIQILGTPTDDLATAEERINAISREIYKINLEYYMSEIPLAIAQSRDGIERVAGIVRSILNFTHPGMQTQERTDINQLVEDTITVARHEYIHYATLLTDLCPNLPLVVCHPGEIGQVILNLVVNSAQSIKSKMEKTEKMGIIELLTREVAEGVEIVVSDTGTGIPKNIQEQVFEPFFTTKQLGKGTGQGLFMVHTMVTKHGGKVWFESSHDKGTTFHVLLPLRPDRSQSEPLAAAGT